MEKEVLQPGDKVIDLKSLYITARALSGAIISAATIWNHTQKISLTIASIFIGFIAMFFVSKVLASYFYPSKKQETTVIKTGKTAIPFALKTTLVGCLFSMVICGLLLAFLLGGLNLLIMCLVINVILAFCVAIVLGTLSALL